MDDFGGNLRQARERRGISLRQIATNTKISVAVLEALERNDTSKLPGAIFSRGFVRSYAIEVGLDPEVTVRKFLEQFDGESSPSGANQASLTEQEHSADTRQRARTVLWLAAAGVVVIGIILYFTLRDRWTVTASLRVQSVLASSAPGTTPCASSGARPAAIGEDL